MNSKINFIREYSSDITIEVAKKVFNSLNNNTTPNHFSSNLDGVVAENAIRDEELLSYFEEILKPELNQCVEDYFSYTELLGNNNFYLNHYSLMHHKIGFNIPFHYDSEYVYEKDGDEQIRNFAILLYLNDIKDGGELIFPVQGQTIKPCAGKLLIFPTSFMFPHTTIPSLEEDRYVLRISYYFNKKAIKNSVTNERSY